MKKNIFFKGLVLILGIGFFCGLASAILLKDVSFQFDTPSSFAVVLVVVLVLCGVFWLMRKMSRGG